MIENGIFKKRRNSREIFCFFLIKKIKREEEDDFFSCFKVGKKEGFVYFGNYEDQDYLKGDFNWIFILN